MHEIQGNSFIKEFYRIPSIFFFYKRIFIVFNKKPRIPTKRICGFFY